MASAPSRPPARLADPVPVGTSIELRGSDLVRALQALVGRIDLLDTRAAEIMPRGACPGMRIVVEIDGGGTVTRLDALRLFVAREQRGDEPTGFADTAVMDV